jgi:hypothetical protein
MIQAGPDVAALCSLGNASSVLCARFVALVAQARDRAMAKSLDARDQFFIGRGDLGKLLAREARALRRDGVLAEKMLEMPLIRRARFDQRHRRRMIDEIALARQVGGQLAGERSRDPHQLRVDKGGACNSIIDVRQERPRACGNQRPGQHKPGGPAANKPLKTIGAHGACRTSRRPGRTAVLDR